jgi:hypothetical protein
MHFPGPLVNISSLGWKRGVGKVGFVGTCPCLTVTDQLPDHRPGWAEDFFFATPFWDPLLLVGPHWPVC